MRTVTIYSGNRIRRVVTCPDANVDLQLQSGEALIEGAYSDGEFYVVDGEPVERPDLDVPETITATAGDTVEIATDLPAETFVAIDGVACGVIDDGTLEIEVARPGVMVVLLTPIWPLRPATVRIEIDEIAPD